MTINLPFEYYIFKDKRVNNSVVDKAIFEIRL